MLALRKIRLSKFDVIVILSTAFLIFSYYASALLTSNVVISNRGQIGIDVYAASGSASDIQAAVNLISSSGGTVHVPAGTFYWNGETVTIPGGVNVKGASNAGCQGNGNNWEAYTATTILHNNHAQGVSAMPNMFSLDGSNGKAIRISGIQFEATAPVDTTAETAQVGSAIYGTIVKNFRVDHCTFINFCNVAVSFDCSSGEVKSNYNSYGVIDHCVVDNPYKLSGSGWAWGYGFYSRGNMKPDYGNWDNDVTHFLGKYEAIMSCTIMFVEDCHFTRCRHSTDAIQGSWNVVRFNLFDNAYPDWGDIDLHGSQTWYSGRGMEVYNNTVNGGTMQQALGGVRLRGGAGFVFNNTVIYATNSALQTLMVLDNIDYSVSYPYTNINNTYIWNNTNTNSTALRVLQGTENVNYFLHAPTLAQDGFTYTPYPYPHPLATRP